VHGRSRNRLAVDYWESNLELADPARHSANFVVCTPNQLVPARLAIADFGKPARTYRYAGYVIGKCARGGCVFSCGGPVHLLQSRCHFP